MANLPGNTQYSTVGSIKLPSAKEMSALIKAKQAALTSPTSSPASSAPRWGAYGNNSQPSQTTQPLGLGNFPVDQSIGQQFPGKFQNLSQYVQQTGDTQSTVPTDLSKNIISGGPDTRIANMPSNLGEGQYLTDPSQPGMMVKSQRGENAAGLNTAEDQAIRGSLNPKTAAIDHIIPLWAGGANTLANKEVLPINVHEQKTKVQAVPYTLLINGVINNKEALAMAQNWSDKDANAITTFNQGNGQVDLAEAKQIADSWTKTKPVTLKDILKGIPEAGKKVLNAIDEYGRAKAPAPIWEFTKGAASGYALGYGTEGEFKSYGNENTDKVSKVARTVGNILGTIGAYATFTGIVRSSAEKLGLKALIKSVPLISETLPMAVTEGGGVAVNAANLAKNSKIANIVKDMAGMAAFGQLSKQEQNDFEGRTKRFLSDVAYGGLMGVAGHNLAGYGKVGAGSMVISLIEGQNAADALTNAAIITGLHGLGHGSETGKIAEQNKFIDNKATESALDYRKKWIGESAVAKEYSPESIQVQNDAITNKIYKLAQAQKWTSDQLNQELAKVRVSGRQLWKGGLGTDLRAQADIDDMKSIGDITRRITDPAELNIPSPVVNTAKNFEDIFARKRDLQPFNAQSENPNGFFATSGYALKDPKTGKPLESGIKATARFNYFDKMRNAGNASDTVMLAERSELEPMMRAIDSNISPEQIKNNTATPHKNPQNSVEIFGMVKPIDMSTPIPDGVIRLNGKNGPIDVIPMGWVARESRIDGRSGSFNDNARQLAKARNIDPNTLDLFDPKNNKDAVANAMRKNGMKVMTADIAKLDPSTASSGNPFLKLGISDQNWAESTKMNAGLNQNPRGLGIFTVAKNAEHETSPTATTQLADDTQNNDAGLTPSKFLVEKASSDEIGKTVAVEVTKKFEEAAKQKTGQEAANMINTTYGDIVSPEMGAELIKSKNDVRVTDILKIFHDAVSTGKASKETQFLYKEILQPFFKKSGFGDSISGNVFRQMKLSGSPIEQLVERANIIAKENPEAAKVAKDIAEAQPVEAKMETVVPEKKASWTRFSDNKHLDAPIQIVSKTVTDPKEIKSIKKSFTKDAIDTMIDDISVNNPNMNEGSKVFQKQLLGKISDITGETPTLSTREQMELNKFYKKQVLHYVRPSVEISPEGAKVVYKPSRKGNIIGPADESTMAFNSKHNLGEDAMSIVRVDNASVFADPKTGESTFVSDKKFDDLTRKMSNVTDDQGKKSKYVLVGKANKEFNSLTFVKYEPKLKEIFDKNPSKYSKPDEKLTDTDKFLRVYTKDVLGIGDVDAAAMNKRVNAVYQRFNHYTGDTPNRTITTHILDSKKIQDIGGLDTSRLSESDKSSKAINDKLNTALVDGTMYNGPKLMEHLWKSGDNPKWKNKASMKPLIQGENADGQYMMQKGHATKLDEPTKQYLEDLYGVKIGPWDMVTFKDNVKIGNKEAATADIPLKNFYFRDASYDKGAIFGPSIMSKFSNADNLNSVFDDMTQKRLTEYNTDYDKLKNVKNKSELDTFNKEYKDKYGVDLMENVLYGNKKELYENEASIKRLRVELEKKLKNDYLDNVVNFRPEKSGISYIKPSIKLPLDGPDQPSRCPKYNEVVVGKEFANKLGVKDGDYVLTGRNPVTDIHNLIKAKVITGDQFGLKLGKDQTLMNSHTITVKLEADTDGDTAFFFKLGEGGIPEEVGNVVEKRTPTDIIIPGAEKRGKLPLTEENLRTVVKNQMIGDDMTSKVSSLSRVIPMLNDNKTQIVIQGKKAMIATNGKVVHTFDVPQYKGEDVSVSFKWNDDLARMVKQVQQEAIDSASSDQLIKTTGGDTNYALKQLLAAKNRVGETVDPSKDKGIVQVVNKALDLYQRPFNTIKNSQAYSNLEEMVNGKPSEVKNQTSLNDSITMLKKMKVANAKMTPLQEQFLKLFGSAKSSLGVTPEAIQTGDVAGRTAVLQAFDKEFTNYQPSEAVRKILKEAKSARELAPKKGEFRAGLPYKEAQAKKTAEVESRKNVVSEYEKALDNDELSDKDIRYLSYWAATSKDSNVSWGLGWEKNKFVRLYDEMMTKAPDIAKMYYKSFEESK